MDLSLSKLILRVDTHPRTALTKLCHYRMKYGRIVCDMVRGEYA